jgi:hypothetical protein
MFPDSTTHWRPYPSIMDGITHPPFPLDRGLWRGVLHLIVLEGLGSRAYGVEIRCEAYAAFEERIYSVVPHDAERSARYDGGVYIKEAASSRLLEAYMKIDPPLRKAEVRHFLFVGTDYCYETLGEEPVIRAFASKDEAYAWVPGESLRK